MCRAQELRKHREELRTLEAEREEMLKKKLEEQQRLREATMPVEALAIACICLHLLAECFVQGFVQGLFCSLEAQDQEAQEAQRQREQRSQEALEQEKEIQKKRSSAQCDRVLLCTEAKNLKSWRLNVNAPQGRAFGRVATLVRAKEEEAKRIEEEKAMIYNDLD